MALGACGDGCCNHVSEERERKNCNKWQKYNKKNHLLPHHFQPQHFPKLAYLGVERFEQSRCKYLISSASAPTQHHRHSSGCLFGRVHALLYKYIILWRLMRASLEVPIDRNFMACFMLDIEDIKNACIHTIKQAYVHTYQRWCIESDHAHGYPEALTRAYTLAVPQNNHRCFFVALWVSERVSEWVEMTPKQHIECGMLVYGTLIICSFALVKLEPCHTIPVAVKHVFVLYCWIWPHLVTVHCWVFAPWEHGAVTTILSVAVWVSAV